MMRKYLLWAGSVEGPEMSGCARVFSITIDLHRCSTLAACSQPHSRVGFSIGVLGAEGLGPCGPWPSHPPPPHSLSRDEF